MLSFTKMHSLGNDFVLLDGVRRPFIWAVIIFNIWPIAIGALGAIN